MRKTKERKEERGREGSGKERKGRERGGERIRSSSVDITHSKFQNRNTTKDHFIIIKEATGRETTGKKQENI